ncbi:MAG: hypothetical protein ACUVSU_09470 [Aggregatilineaceae bacterium]
MRGHGRVGKISWVAVGLTAIALVTSVLAACGGEKKETPQPTPTATQEVSQAVEAEAEGEQPPAPLPTPLSLPPEALFTDASGLARVDLAAYLDVSVESITVLDPDTALLLADPLACPDLEGEDVVPYVIYLQHGRFIYPYQVYEVAGGREPVVERCDDVLVDEEVLYVPTPDMRSAVLDAVRFDLEKRGVDLNAGRFSTVRAMTWTDETLGCPPQAGATPAPALMDGYLIVFTAGGLSYEYHTDTTGDRVLLCEPRGGVDSVEALIAALEAQENLDVVRVEDEVARYNGLNAEGVLLELTTRGYRVGVFSFGSATDARTAAALIDDPGVSRIFVSGRLLIVQEENSPQVYSLLQSLAEEVRAPIAERRDAAATPASDADEE